MRRTATTWGPGVARRGRRLAVAVALVGALACGGAEGAPPGTGVADGAAADAPAAARGDAPGGGAAPGASAPGPGTQVPAADPIGGGVPGGAATEPAVGTGPTAPGAGGGPPSGGPPTGGGTGAPAGGGPAPAPAQPAAAGPESAGPPGAFAGVLLRPAPAAALTLEVLVQEGARPSRGAIDRFAATLRQVSGKPVAVASGVVDGDRRSWSAAEVRTAADAGGTVPQGGGRAVLRLLYLRGSSSDAEGALGVAVRGDVAAVFGDEVRDASTPLLGSDVIERAVGLHEIGHLLGLVDLFLATGRGDPDHPGHSANRGSVMYWAVETGLFADLAGDLPQDFDADDLADLATIRGG